MVICEANETMAEEQVRTLDQSRIRGQELLDRLKLSPQDRQWAEKHGDELLRLYLRRLSERLEGGVSFRAIPAVFAYAQAVVDAIYEKRSP